jgi:hypothetical protein
LRDDGILSKLIIKGKVDSLVKKHKTNNPFEIASAENIIILLEPLGSILC